MIKQVVFPFNRSNNGPILIFVILGLILISSLWMLNKFEDQPNKIV
jgi:hypothetical protein